MSLIDWIYRDQANYDLVRYGIEGEDWEADGEKGYKELTPSNKYLFPTCRNVVRQGSCLTSESEVRQPPCTPYRFIAYRED